MSTRASSKISSNPSPTMDPATQGTDEPPLIHQVNEQDESNETDLEAQTSIPLKMDDHSQTLFANVLDKVSEMSTLLNEISRNKQGMKKLLSYHQFLSSFPSKCHGIPTPTAQNDPREPAKRQVQTHLVRRVHHNFQQMEE